MFGQKIAVIALSALGVVSAQSQNFTIDPNSVELGTRASWCTAQQNNCDTICGAANGNTCDPSTLDWTCTCASGDKPNLADYTGTMPYFVCQEAFTQCNLDHVGDQKGQDNCKTSIRDKCGKKEPAQESTSSPTTSSGGSGSSATPTGDSSPASTGKSSPSSTPEDSAAAMPAGAQYLGLVAAGILAVMI